MLTAQQLIDLPGAGEAEKELRDTNRWDLTEVSMELTSDDGRSGFRVVFNSESYALSDMGRGWVKFAGFNA